MKNRAGPRAVTIPLSAFSLATRAACSLTADKQAVAARLLPRVGFFTHDSIIHFMVEHRMRVAEEKRNKEENDIKMKDTSSSLEKVPPSSYGCGSLVEGDCSDKSRDCTGQTKEIQKQREACFGSIQSVHNLLNLVVVIL